MAATVPPDAPRRRIPAWAWILAAALALRLAAAVLVTWITARKGTLCVFPDTIIYWELARAIVAGEPFRVFQGDAPHYALRTPGYPIFLAACRWLFGPSLLAVRIVQAGVGTLGVWLLSRLVRSAWPEDRRDGWPSLAWIAAAVMAVDPYIVGMSALVLSEAIFIPLMVAGLWAIAAAWTPRGAEPPRHPDRAAILGGLAMGAAVLARPSWLLFVPAVLAAWVIGAGRGRRGAALRGSLLVALAMAALMAPWWVRVYRIHGRFVPTALWVGASLYDGVGPQANGESDMAFVDAPDVRSLPELEQEDAFRRRSWRSIRDDPGRILRLALVKVGRFWSPWPNAAMLRSPAIDAASALITLPAFGLLMLGAWDRRRDFRALALLLGPLVYFCALHSLFVSSIRYRIPGMVPALGLVAAGWVRLGAFAAPSIRSSSREGGPIDGNPPPGA
ncbi:ArnT family glycosyltransferase [Tundrisphaera sp. TA3]|uniref:ArnT family glycosyltransferase n=1 Tax=Tundrisphaera sp. TA3 TaxID=3435775 RepID=UPI003EBB7007